jgi:hypothetical protein
MSSTITVRDPSESGETARALQLANQRRLSERDLDARATREAARQVEREIERAQIMVGEGPWKGAVPEFDPVELALGKRYGKAFKVASAWWKYEQTWDGLSNTAHGIYVSTGNKEHTVRIDLPRISGTGISGIREPRGLLWWRCLPAGGERLVLAFYVQMVNATDVETGEASGSAGPPGVPGAYPGEMVTFHSTNTKGFTYSDLEIAPIIKAAVVSPDGINVLDAPTQLHVTAQRTLTYITGGSVSEFTDPEGGMAQTETWIWNTSPDDGNPDSWDGFWSLFELIKTKLPVTKAEIITTYANSKKWDNDNYVWMYLLRSYGYGRLVDRSKRAVGYEQDPGWGWTPAVFSCLKNYGGEFHVNYDNPLIDKLREDATNYKIVRERYFADDAPPFLLTSGYQSDAGTAAGIDTTADYWYFKAPIADTVSAVSTADFDVANLAELGTQLRRNGGTFKKEPISSTLESNPAQVGVSLSGPVQDGALVKWEIGNPATGISTFNEIPVIAWDWNRPLACWLELQRMGFTASDLGLSEEETRALANADPAAAAFRF